MASDIKKQIEAKERLLKRKLLEAHGLRVHIKELDERLDSARRQLASVVGGFGQPGEVAKARKELASLRYGERK